MRKTKIRNHYLPSCILTNFHNILTFNASNIDPACLPKLRVHLPCLVDVKFSNAILEKKILARHTLEIDQPCREETSNMELSLYYIQYISAGVWRNIWYQWKIIPPENTHCLYVLQEYCKGRYYWIYTFWLFLSIVFLLCNPESWRRAVLRVD